MSGHRRALAHVPERPPAHLVARLNAITLAVVNGVAALALGFGATGSSPSLAIMSRLLPMRLWAVLFGAVAVLLLFKQYVPAHTMAAVLWPYWGICAAIGVLLGATTSPAATVALTGLILGMAVQHLISLWWRRLEWSAARASRRGGRGES